MKSNTDAAGTQLENLTDVKQIGIIKEIDVNKLYLKELNNPHIYSEKHMLNRLNEALSADRLEGFNEAVNWVVECDSRGLLVTGTNQIRIINNGFEVEIRVFIDNFGVVRSLDAFVITGNNLRNINNVINLR